jgi:hypothetical protein
MFNATEDLRKLVPVKNFIFQAFDIQHSPIPHEVEPSWLCEDDLTMEQFLVVQRADVASLVFILSQPILVGEAHMFSSFCFGMR